MSPTEEAEVKCYQCQNSLPFEAGKSIGRLEECNKCYASLHCCKMCNFYDTSSYNECREPVAQRILEKEKSNFCDFFKVKSITGTDTTKDNLIASANALFKN